MSKKEIIKELDKQDMQELLKKAIIEKKIVVVKFTAQWCGPCQRIKADCYTMFNQLPDKIIVADLDVDLDKNCEFYGFMKRKRLVNGIPVLMAWAPKIDRPFWYVPDESVTGGDIHQIKAFLQRVFQVSLSI